MSAQDTTDLEVRLRAVEDRLAILDLIAGSALSSDISSRSYWAALFAEDAVLDREAGGADLQGRATLADIMISPGHVAGMESGMAHLCAVPHIRINGDSAVAAGYFQIIIPNPVGPDVEFASYGQAKGHMIWRLTANRWELARMAEGWQITRRSIRPVPGEEARRILRDAIGAVD